MLQDNRPQSGTSPSATQAEGFERTLLYHKETGEFTFDSLTQKSTGAFRIALETAQKIVVNAGEGIEFMSPSPEFLGPLPFQTSGALLLPPTGGTRIEIDVINLPSTRGLLGFLLYVQLTQGTPTVKGIQVPPFFVTRNQPSTEQELVLQYTPSSGDFTLTEVGTTHHLPMTINVAKGMIIPRLSNGSNANNSTVRKIRVFLDSDPEVVFADLPAVFTLASGPTVQRLSDTEILIDRDFTSGTGFGLSFGVKIHLGDGQTCTVYSPDPVIIDKTVGSNPPDSQ